MLLKLILASASLLAASIGAAQFMLPGDDTPTGLFGDQAAPSIAQGGGVTLAVWHDGRALINNGYEYETGYDLYGMRMDAAGNFLDAKPFPIAIRKSNQKNPKVAWNGTNFLVVFESMDLGGTGYYQASLEAVRVAPTGYVLDPAPIKLYGLTPSGYLHCVASDGANWIVVNQSTSSSADIVAVRISPSGILLDPPTRRIVQATYYSRSNLRLAYAGGVFLLTFDDAYGSGTNTTAYVRFLSDLTTLDAAPVPFLPSSVYGLASNGSGFYVLWNQQQPDFSMVLTGTRVNAAGTKLDGAGRNISGAFPLEAYASTSVVWDGINWRASWGSAGLLRLARINTAGTVLDAGGVGVTGPQTGATAANGAGGVQLAWVLYANGSTDVYTAFVSAANSPGPNRTLSFDLPLHIRPDVAGNGKGFMLVYQSLTHNQKKAFAQPLDALGKALTPGPVLLDSGDALNGPTAPNVAWNGTHYLVAWSNVSSVFVQRLTPAGAKVDLAPLAVMTPAFGPADVAAIGDTFLVIARRYGYTPQYVFAIGVRVKGTDGAVLDPSPLILGGSYLRTAPAVVAMANKFLVAFHSNVTHDDSMAGSAGVFVPTTGPAGTSFTIHGPFSTAGGNGIFEVGLAANADKALFVQSQELTSGVENDMLMRFVNSDGTVGAMTNLAPWTGNQYRPRVSWDGTHFVIVYQEQKNRDTYWTMDQLDARSDIFGMRISPTGTVIDPQGFAISTLPSSETDPAVFSYKGRTMVAAAIAQKPGYLNGYRIATWLAGGANKWPVAVASASPSSGDVPIVVNFSSAGTIDLDGTIASRRWDFGDGFGSSQPNPSHTYTKPGPFVARLFATDNSGATTQQTVFVDVAKPNVPPVASGLAAPASGPAPLDVALYADRSYDPDGFLGNIHWRFSDDGSEYWGSTSYHTFTSNGTHTVTLTVYDFHGATGVSTITVRVGPSRPSFKR